ncbi:hypothetical protein BJ138DRAFT_1163709 [Hygrophoropsis aurantiaca]|uniref:Uncharacterized protein n=1 Tax=Hygrophoropsis aurantiaca TaxID=72124 RepID=A0ACB7ZZ48_9AGAM|nr:hypothetical protein BJ138DRAFT_1163709 [Hygrophoropsis aurantiaca]
MNWTETNEVAADLDPHLLEDVVDGIPPSQSDHYWGYIPTPSFEPSIPQAHPGLYHLFQDSYQMNESHGAPLESQIQSMPPAHAAGPLEALLPPYEPYQSHQEDFTPQLHTPSTNRPTKHFAYKCEWVSTDGQVCDMHFASDKNSIFRHLVERHQVHRVGTSLCRWGGVCRALHHDTIARHVMAHVQIKWACSSCNYIATRPDAVKKHINGSTSQCLGAYIGEVRGTNALILDVSPFARGQ